jgi:hypothetical protein
MAHDHDLAVLRALIASKARTRNRRPHDPVAHEEFECARREYKAARITQHIEKLVAEAPPLTTAQRDRLRQVLRAGDTA